MFKFPDPVVDITGEGLDVEARVKHCGLVYTITPAGGIHTGDWRFSEQGAKCDFIRGPDERVHTIEDAVQFAVDWIEATAGDRYRQAKAQVRQFEEQYGLPVKLSARIAANAAEATDIDNLVLPLANTLIRVLPPRDNAAALGWIYDSVDVSHEVALVRVRNYRAEDEWTYSLPADVLDAGSIAVEVWAESMAEDRKRLQESAVRYAETEELAKLEARVAELRAKLAGKPAEIAAQVRKEVQP